MSSEGGLAPAIHGLPLPVRLVEAVRDGTWMSLASSPRVEEVFGEPPIRPSFYSLSAMAKVTSWWRDELDEETLRCYFGTPDKDAPSGYISRMSAVMVGILGPDLLIALNYGESFADPPVVFLGERGSWRKISDSISRLLYLLQPES